MFDVNDPVKYNGNVFDLLKYKSHFNCYSSDPCMGGHRTTDNALQRKELKCLHFQEEFILNARKSDFIANLLEEEEDM